jgi:MFS family permease
MPGHTDMKAKSTLRRIGWLHFLNDLTLDFLTPLLPAGVGAAWIGVMEGLADGIGQVLKLFTGRASDRTGQRARWVMWGYSTNAIMRPLTGIGMLCAWPLWIMCCRVGDRIGKGLRGSATDALVADWTDDAIRGRTFAHMRMMDHLGATVGGLAAALTAWLVPTPLLGWVVASLVSVAGLVVWISRGLQDAPHDLPAPLATPLTPAPLPSAPIAWWPTVTAARLALIAITIAGCASRLSPLLVLVLVAGLPTADSTNAWPLWLVCLGWAACGFVQSIAAALTGPCVDRLGAKLVLQLGWIALAGICLALGYSTGPWVIVAGLGFALVTGVLDGVEKAWMSLLVPKTQRGVTFGALALVTAGAGLIGNGACGLWLAMQSHLVFAALAMAAMLGAALLWLPGLSVSAGSKRA